MSNSNTIRAGNITRLVTLIVAVILTSHYFNLSANIVILKLLVVPMFWLSMIGIQYLYKEPISLQEAFSINVVEYFLLFVLLVAGFLMVLMWTLGVSVSVLLTGLLAAFILGVAVLLYMHYASKKK